MLLALAIIGAVLLVCSVGCAIGFWIESRRPIEAWEQDHDRKD